jgi:hypothetical protein
MTSRIGKPRRHWILLASIVAVIFGLLISSSSQSNSKAIVIEASSQDSDTPGKPTVKGHVFVPVTPIPIAEPTTEIEKQALTKQLRGGTLTEPTNGQAPAIRRRRGSLNEAPNSAVGFKNSKSWPNPNIFEYTNDGARNRATACGQAAIATLLTAWGVKSADTGNTLIREIESRYPQDVAFGNLGTSWQRMEQALKGYGLKTFWTKGLGELMNYVKAGYPAAVMLDVGRIKVPGFEGWGGHWVVAYALDNNNIYLTNWGGDGTTCSWKDFNTAGHTWLTTANGTTDKALVAYR